MDAFSFVMTIDQRGSRRDGDKVPELLELLATAQTVLPFQRSVGDEVQGVLADPAAVVETVTRVLRNKGWYIGIGVGAIDLPIPQNSREASGGAFIAAREAVEAAKKTGDRVPLRICAAASRADSRVDPEADSDAQPRVDFRPGEDAGATVAEWSAAAQAVLILLGDVVRHRSTAEWRVLDALESSPASSQKMIAEQLGITPQAVSKAVFRAGQQEEQQGKAAATLLLRYAAATSINVRAGS